jgi:hypothetical protein
VAKLFWVSLLAIFLDFTCFLLCLATLILPCMQEYFRLAEGISSEAANIIFDKAARKVIKDVADSAVEERERGRQDGAESHPEPPACLRDTACKSLVYVQFV